MRLRNLTNGALLVASLLVMSSFACNASASKRDYFKMTRSEILKVPVSELADLPFEELMAISDQFSY